MDKLLMLAFVAVVVIAGGGLIYWSTQSPFTVSDAVSSQAQNTLLSPAAPTDSNSQTSSEQLGQLTEQGTMKQSSQQPAPQPPTSPSIFPENKKTESPATTATSPQIPSTPSVAAATTTSLAPSSSQPVPSQPQPITVTYTNGGFSPSNITITKGTTVIFKNESGHVFWPASNVHPSHGDYGGTSLSEHCPDTAGTAFDSCAAIQAGESWSFTFNKVGNWGYHDHIAPTLNGTVVVQ